MEKQGRFVKGDLAVVTSASAALDQSIEDSIYTIRGVQVILDTDIAELYGIETKRLNEQVRRNASRFPSDFMFQLTQDEFVCLRSQNATTNWSKRRSMPYAFTELGVSMLSSVLSSEAAIQANIQIMRAFAAMRRFLVSNAQIFQRLDVLEYKQIATDQRVDRLFEKLEEGKLEPRQGIFFEDQVFDAYGFVSNLIKQATRNVVLFDNYVDETVLTLLDKREVGVSATIYSKQISQQLQLDLARHNAQNAPIEIKPFNKTHDRFLIIDDKVYHIGASLKDLGKKWFAFSLMNDIEPHDLISKI
ncbi:MAG: ORF6N domain-containing protein [Bacteroidales bacterium]|nr:ORF6N domain-containing protein [Bacteroidales bacterium]